MKPYSKDKSPKGIREISKPHGNKKNKLRVDKKGARQKAKVSPFDRHSFPHAYICGDCARNKGLVWPAGHCATVHEAVCDYCQETKMLAAVLDYAGMDT